MSREVSRLTSARIAQFVSELDLGRTPEDVVASAERCLIDTIGVGIAGGSTQVSSRMQAAVGFLRESGPATIWGTGAEAPPGTAALINAAAIHAEDFDDTHTAGVVHGSACVVPAAWAAAEVAGLDISDVLRGVVAGWEVAARLGVSSAGAFHRRGLHTTSVVGVFAAAAAAAAVWRLTEPQTVAALGLAGSAASGLNVYLLDGTAGKLLNPGFAAQAGLQAAALGGANVSGPTQVFEGRMGVFDALGEGVPELDEVMRDLGERWELQRVSVKPYPACHFAHATIDAAIELRRTGLQAHQIEAITCRLPAATFDILCRPWSQKLSPSSEYAVKFSIPWLVALALIDGDITRRTFQPGVLDRAEVRDLAAKVRVEEWSGSPYPESFPGSLVVRLHDGTERSAQRLVNRGHPSEPLSNKEIESKFLACVADRFSSEDSERLLAGLHDLTRPVRDFVAIFGAAVHAARPASLPT